MWDGGWIASWNPVLFLLLASIDSVSILHTFSMNYIGLVGLGAVQKSADTFES